MKIDGYKLKEIRERMNVTRAELALVADLTHVRIWQLETEPESNVNANVGKALARKLKCKTEDIEVRP